LQTTSNHGTHPGVENDIDIDIVRVNHPHDEMLVEQSV
jgi:hypothetical protein